eukprot:12262658-Prorocentrum_lima.AAC.1
MLIMLLPGPLPTRMRLPRTLLAQPQGARAPAAAPLPRAAAAAVLAAVLEASCVSMFPPVHVHNRSRSVTT